MYLSYKSTTAYSWLGYTYLIARNLSSWCWSRHQSSSWPGRIKNREIEWKAEGDSHLCFFYLWFFFLISLVEAIQLIPWWWILFLRCELYHHLLRLPLPDNSLIMMLTVPPWIQTISWRPFFPLCHPFPLPCMLDKNLIWSCISCSLCFSLVVSESINFQ